MKKYLFLFILFTCVKSLAQANSVAKIWNEVQLNAIRTDLARPPVQARNLFHVSIAMYDAWAAYDSNCSTYLLGKTINGVHYPFTGIPAPANLEDARKKAISYAAYRLLKSRYSISPNWSTTKVLLDSTFISLGYDSTITGINYSVGDPAQLGNYIAEKIISMGLGDGANQSSNYAGTGYAPVNPPLMLSNPGNSTMINVNRWQPLSYVTCIDQNGNPCGTATPSFVTPHWGNVNTFSMPKSTATVNMRSGYPYPVYLDPGSPPLLNTSSTLDSMSNYYKWGHQMVVAWSSHLSPDDTTTWDISPNGKGNVSNYPVTLAQQQAFYDFTNGKTEMGNGHLINPSTGQPYVPQLVKRGDYTRVASQYWADGPTSETPPGHWYTLLNKANEHPSMIKKMGGVGPICPDLEWDVKSYFMLGGAMHDAAIVCLGVKGWYDSPRPISSIRKMAALGQSSNPALPLFHAGGIQLIPGLIEQVTFSDPFYLRGSGNVNVNKIKIKAWMGFPYITYFGTTPMNHAGVGWILAENWMPYQRETFVTPPFAGYYSGHSTYSRAGATVMTLLTGNPYFPGGMAEYTVQANSTFIGFEKGPSTTVKLQWATYKDASDEASLSRIWGGIHPPFDDIPGRIAGEQVGNQVYQKALTYFNNAVIDVTLSMNQTNPVCTTTPLIFTASVSNSPGNLTYTWKKNGIVAFAGTSNTYTSTSFADNDVFLCEISAGSYKVGSNAIQITTDICSPSMLHAKLLLQGYYDADGYMFSALTNQGAGTNTNITDSVTVELHDSVYPYALLQSMKVPMLIDGSLSCYFTIPAGSYYVAVKHRNSIETWSSAPVLTGTNAVYNFTSGASQAFGNNMIEVQSGRWAFFTGELNADENVDLLDYTLLENDINGFASGYLASDINGDGNVDLLDSPMMEANINSFIFSAKP